MRFDSLWLNIAGINGLELMISFRNCDHIWVFWIEGLIQKVSDRPFLFKCQVKSDLSQMMPAFSMSCLQWIIPLLFAGIDIDPFSRRHEKVKITYNNPPMRKFFITLVNFDPSAEIYWRFAHSRWRLSGHDYSKKHWSGSWTPVWFRLYQRFPADVCIPDCPGFLDLQIGTNHPCTRVVVFACRYRHIISFLSF